MAANCPIIRVDYAFAHLFDFDQELRIDTIAFAAFRHSFIGICSRFLLDDPRGGPRNPWVQLAAAEWELLLGLWLLSGSLRRGSWFAEVATFLLFAGVSAFFGINGVESCGCLGVVSADPWWTFAADVVALAMLGFAYPRERIASRESGSGVKWAFGVAVLLVGISLSASVLYGSPDAALARLRGDSLVIASSLDLGGGQPGRSVAANATIQNITRRPIRLVGGTSDCSCTAVRDLPVTIEPGESVSVGIEMKIPESENGRFSRTVFLRTDDSSQPVVRFEIVCRAE